MPIPITSIKQKQNTTTHNTHTSNVSKLSILNLNLPPNPFHNIFTISLLSYFQFLAVDTPIRESLVAQF